MIWWDDKHIYKMAVLDNWLSIPDKKKPILVV